MATLGIPVFKVVNAPLRYRPAMLGTLRSVVGPLRGGEQKACGTLETRQLEAMPMGPEAWRSNALATAAIQSVTNSVDSTDSGGVDLSPEISANRVWSSLVIN